MKKPKLTQSLLLQGARAFTKKESEFKNKELYGVTDGKAVGTYIEHKFRKFLKEKYSFIAGNSAKGIDFSELEIDTKVTSITQPQSSCPFKSATQKIYGLGYSVLVFVYDKVDDSKSKTARLKILHTIFVEKKRTADYQITKGIRQILSNKGNVDDLVAFIQEKNLPVDDIEANKIARDLLKRKPEQGYLTISNALQWRLQYTRIIEEAGRINGIARL